MPQTKIVTNFGDVVSVGQLAQQWEKPRSFVKGLIAEGKLVRNASGFITNESLHAYYKTYGVPTN